MRMALLVDFHRMKGFATVSNKKKNTNDDDVVVWAMHTPFYEIETTMRHPVLLATHLLKKVHPDKAAPSGILENATVSDPYKCPHCDVEFLKPEDLAFHLLATYKSPKEAATLTFCQNDPLACHPGYAMLSRVNRLMNKEMVRMTCSAGIHYIIVPALPPPPPPRKRNDDPAIDWIPPFTHSQVQELCRKRQLCLLLRRDDAQLKNYLLFKNQGDEFCCPCCGALYAHRKRMLKHLCQVLSKRPHKPPDYSLGTAMSLLCALQREFCLPLNGKLVVRALFPR